MGNKSRFKKLFEPGRMGGMDIKNRIVMPAMASTSGAKDGFATEITRDYLEARAKGGVGAIIVGSLCIDYPIGISGQPRLSIDDDKFIPALNEVVQAIHRHDVKAIAQLHHAGNTAPQDITGLQPVAPSAVLRRTMYMRPLYFMPRELSIGEIKELVVRFAKGAERAQKAGFDGVEIHAAHRYLINTFLSPYYNRRKDKYGGDLRNRARFLLEIISAIREVVGPDYPLICRINGKETDVEGGITLELAKELAQLLQNTGQVDALHVSICEEVGVWFPPGVAVDLAAGVKKVVSMPVIAVARLGPHLGEKILRQKKADFIAMGRPLLADPELPNKVASGRLDDIAPCLYCNNCLNAPRSVEVSGAVRECTVNAATGREREYEIKPAEKAKKVLIVGGGPGGMEAARVAALRGHQVTLYEKDRRLGGQLTLACILREEDEALIKYLATQISKLGVRIELEKEVNPALIADIKPDVVVLATGATSSLPEIPGINRDNVLSASDVQEMMHGHLKRAAAKGRVSCRRRLWYLGSVLMRVFPPSFMRWLLRLWAPFGKRVIVIGRGLAGVELADFLIQRGKRVTIVDTHEDIPFGEPPMAVIRQYLEFRLIERGTAMFTVAEYEKITDRGLVIINKKGQRQTIEGDTIVFVTDYKPNSELSQALAGLPYEIHLVGDCIKPCGILEAIQDGSRVGRVV